MTTKTEEQITIAGGGMTCASCAKKGENALAVVEGVRGDRDDQVIGELLELCALATK